MESSNDTNIVERTSRTLELRKEKIAEIHKLNNLGWTQFTYCCDKVQQFRKLIKNRDHDSLKEFITEIETDEKNIFYSFIHGLVKYINAVRNSLIYAYSNGLLEGHVNKLKVKKRIMYGRTGYELLSKKVLFLDTQM